jgi:hypothetical protein
MKRDMDLVLQILTVVEASESGHAPHPIEVLGFTDEVISFHALLMGEAGLLLVEDISAQGDPSPCALVHRMTWAGYEFLDVARNKTVWNSVKNTVTAKGGSVSFELLKFLLIETAKSYFGGPLLLPHP